jgi:hypothetical protein
MSAFELSVICKPEQSFEIMQILKDANIKFKKKEERALAPELEIIKVVIELTPALIPVITRIIKKFYEKKTLVEFESRYELAKKMLEGMQPLYCESLEDRKDRSYYVFKTTKCRYFWEVDRGEIRFGPLGESKNACAL